MPYLINQNPDGTWTWKLVVENNHEIAISPNSFISEDACRGGIEQVRREAHTPLVQYGEQ